jgi:hypothetical protein
LLLGGLSIAAVLAEEQPQYTIGMSEIPNLLGKSDDNQGPYNQIVASLFGTDKNIEIRFIPPSRADKLFEEKKLDCLFPAHIAILENSRELIQSLPVNTSNAYIFSRHAYSSLENFDTQVITLRRGFSYGDVTSRIKAQFMEVNTDKQNIELLQLHRTDGFIAYLLDAKGAYQQVEFPMHYYNPELPVYSVPEALLCYDTVKNRKLMSTTNTKIAKMLENNDIQHWLSAKSSDDVAQ